MTQISDIAIVGGGLAGRAAAIVAARLGFETLHIAPGARPDHRTSALMGPSVSFLIEMGLVGDPTELGVPLAEIRIIDATDRFLRAPETHFRASEFGHESFGWNFANSALARTFDDAARGIETLSVRDAVLSDAGHGDEGWTLRLGNGTEVRTRLLVGADGKASKVRDLAGIEYSERRHGQSALVCDLELERPLGVCSVEYHYRTGPFTLVPAGGNKANLVWIDEPGALEAARDDETVLRGELARRSMRLFGALEPTTPGFVFPLSSLKVETAGKNGAVLVGEAAHAFPPIGAQGLNLGLRDISDLAEVLKRANRSSYGWAEMAARSYAHMRKGDLMRTGRFVDALFGTLLSDHIPAQGLRTGGLWALKSIPLLRRQAIRFGMGRA